MLYLTSLESNTCLCVYVCVCIFISMVNTDTAGTSVDTPTDMTNIKSPCLQQHLYITACLCASHTIINRRHIMVTTMNPSIQHDNPCICEGNSQAWQTHTACRCCRWLERSFVGIPVVCLSFQTSIQKHRLYCDVVILANYKHNQICSNCYFQ